MKEPNSQFQGGLYIDSPVKVLVNGRTETMRLGDLRAGQLLGQTGSEYYFPIDELLISRRRQVGFRIKLESGEEITAAEGTILCGQYGPNLIADTPDQVVCMVNVGRFYDRDSRRKFEVKFIGPESALKILKSICRHTAKRHSILEKKFYTWNETARFLDQLRSDHPEFQIVPGIQVGMHGKEGLYDLLKAVIPVRDTFYRSRGAFMPLFQLQQVSGATPTDLAFVDNHYTVTHRKVVSCEAFESDGPWALPVFDEFSETRGSSKFRTVFVVNNIPVSLPNAFVTDFAISATLPRKGQEIYPPEQIPAERLSDVESIYDELVQDTPRAKLLAREMDQQIEVLGSTLRRLAAGRVTWDKIEKRLGQRFGA